MRLHPDITGNDVSWLLWGNSYKKHLLTAAPNWILFFYCYSTWHGALCQCLHCKCWLKVLRDDKISRCKGRFSQFSESFACLLPNRRGFFICHQSGYHLFLLLFRFYHRKHVIFVKLLNNMLPVSIHFIPTLHLKKLAWFIFQFPLKYFFLRNENAIHSFTKYGSPSRCLVLGQGAVTPGPLPQWS